MPNQFLPQFKFPKALHVHFKFVADWEGKEEGVRGEGRADCLTLDVSEEDCVSVVLCNTQL